MIESDFELWELFVGVWYRQIWFGLAIIIPSVECVGIAANRFGVVRDGHLDGCSAGRLECH